MTAGRKGVDGMHDRRRTGWTAALRAAAMIATLLAVAAPGTGLAAEPSLPPDLVADAVVTVVFLDEHDVGIEGAAVNLIATRDGVVISHASSQSDASGRTVFDGVPRAIDGAPVLLEATAALDGPTVVVDGCLNAESWYGAARGVIAVAVVEVVLPAEGALSAQCPPLAPTDAPAVPVLTLPPTDGIGPRPETPETPVLPVAMLLAALAFGLLVAAARRARG